MYEYQLNVFNKYIHENRFVLTMPPGSGKSFIVVACMRWLINLNKKRKVIIAVPTVHIAKTFKKCVIEYPDDTQLIWDIYNDLCIATENQKIQKIINFINQKEFTNNPNERVLITTHAALSQAHMKLQNNNISELYNDISVIIDEAHHILYSEDKQKNQLVNRMGNLIRDINGNQNCVLWFVTATPFRGDQASIIPQEQFNQFKRHNLLLDEHWKKNIKYIQNFEFNFVTYEEDMLFKNIEEVLSLQKRKTIIFCPYVGRLIRNSDKNTFKRKLIRHIKKVWPEANIIDLISTHKRNEKKLMLEDDDIAKSIDIILTLKIFDEGSDWVIAEQCIDLTPTNSLTKQYQRFGRVWRDYLDKNNIYYYAFIPYKDNFKTTEEKRRHVSNSYNTFVGSLLLEEVINPIPVIKKINNGNNRNKVIKRDPLTKGVNYNNAKKQFVIKEVIKKLTILKAENKILTAEKAKEGIIEVLNNNKIYTNHEDIMVYIIKLLKNRNRNKNNIKKIPNWKQEGIDLSWMSEQGFDKIWSNDILDSVLTFGTNTCNIKHFSEFKKVFNSEYKPIKYYVQLAERLAREHGGILLMSQLRKDKHFKLIRKIYSCPKEFIHIKIEYINMNKQPLEYYVKLAEKLANKNNGTLVLSELSNKNKKYVNLKYSINSNPKAFSHINIIKQSRIHIDEYIELAKKLEDQNGGKLELKKLKKEHPKLLKEIHRRAKDFSHINIINSRTLVDDRVAEAEQLAIKHGGKLIMRQTSKSLLTAIYRYPEKFAHIPKDIYDRTSLKEYVKLANSLTNKNNELIMKDIRKKYKNLCNTIHKNPESFKHIKIITRKKNVPQT